MLVGLVSAKGSPGVTTAALALAAAAGPVDGLLVELDPSGGSVECWTGVTGEPGMIRVASDLRRSVQADALLAHAVDAPPGVRSILAPSSSGLAESALVAADDRLGPALSALGVPVVIADAGRWSRSQATARRLLGAAVVAVVCMPTVAGVEHARWLIDPLVSTMGVPVVLLLVGDRPYPATEVAASVGVPVVAAVAWDPRGFNALLTGGVGRAWARSALARSARVALDGLRAHAAETEVLERD